MSIFKIVLSYIGGIILLVMLSFGTGLINLEYKKFFKPKLENVERSVFEETKSYTHGKIQDLAKYYEEYNKDTTIEDKESIKSLIKLNFAEFNADKIKAHKLKIFLTDIRGY